jgi:hypothetical protein
MAEWFKPRVIINENGLNIRRISLGSKSCPLRKTKGWANGDKKTRPVVTNMAGLSKILKGQSAEWLIDCRERTKYTPDNIGIKILSLINNHRLGGC